MDDGFLRNKHYRLWNDWQFYYKGFWTSFEAEARGEEFMYFADCKDIPQQNIRILLVLNMPW